MREEQKLYPQLIYRINNALSELKTEFEENKDLLISPSVLNPYSRIFNWLLVAEGTWNLSKSLMSGIQRKIKNSKNEWKQFKEEFKKIEEVKSVADAIHSIENSENLKPEEYHSALLFLYQSYPINNKEYFDGIIYQNLIRRAKKDDGKNHRIDYAKAELLIKNRKDNELYPPVDIVFYGEQEEPKKNLPQVKNNTNISNNNFHKNYLLPFFGKYENTFDPKTFLVLKPEHFSKFQFLYIRPFYDALYGQYGNICGILTIFFSKSQKRDSFIKSKVNEKLIARLPSYVEEIKRAALFEILQQPIKTETDLLEHYIKWLPMLQDWEFIRVFQIKNSEEVLLNYCYRRKGEDEDREKGKWKRCERNYKECKDACSIKVNNDGILEDKELSKKLVEDKNKHIAYDETTFGKGHKHKALLENIFTERYIPELDEYDKASCKDKIVIYEYPSYTIIPDDEPKEHKLGLFYERQQIDLLRQLAIKRKVIRETIKHGTRAAVAAIDVRNLSHNIASHVLSYWGNIFTNINSKKEMQKEYNRESKWEKEEEIEKEIEKLQKKFSEGSGPLFAYIRKRMDFIADLITTVPSWEKTFLLKQDIVDVFTEQTVLLDNIVKSEGFCYAKGCKKKIESSEYKWPDCIKEGSSCPKLSEEKIEKHDQPEPFEIKFIPKGQDFYVSIPHGNIGIHAFYSILENFIRNSAKHGGKTLRDQIKKSRAYKDSLKITISVKDIGDYLEVTIKDNVGNCKDAITEIKEGFPPSKESHFANNDGSIKKGKWGIKEMRLSANFLRKRPVEVIEDRDKDVEKHPILSISCESSEEKFDAGCNSNINYKLYLRKPSEVFIVRDTVENISEYQNLKNIGICVATLDNIKKDLQQGNSIPHRFLLFDLSNRHDEILKLVESYRTKLPFRIIINSHIPFLNYSKDLWREPVYANLNINYNSLNSNLGSQIKELYEKFVENKIGNRKILIRVKDGRLPLWNNHSICEVKNTIDSCDYEKIIFDDHFYGKNELDNYKCFYLGLSGSINPILHNLILNPPPSEESEERGKKEIFLYEFIEAAMVKVLIADERIWKNAQLKVYGRTKREFLEKMNIDCIKIEGSTIKIDDLVNKKGYAVLVIHQGLLEKMNQEDTKKFNKWYKENRPYIVVDSGRGVPNELLDEARFIHISALEQFIDEMDKYALVQTVFSLRRPNDERQINSRDKL